MKDQNEFWVIVKTNARENMIKSISDDGTLYVLIAEKAIGNKANETLIKYLSRYFKKQVRIIHGFSSKRKKLRLN